MRGTAGVPVRLRYSKLGKIRWISHRDVARVLERAFRVSGLPLAFSEGFSPRPKVSFGLALSTGHESIAEYLDLVLTEEVELDALPPRLGDGFPDGMAVTGAAPLVDRAPALQESVTAVEWRLEVVRADGSPVDTAALQAAVDTALAAPALEVTRRRKGRDVIDDIRPVIRSVDVLADTAVPGGSAALHLELHTQPKSAKPGDVLAAIDTALVESRALRTCQWIERDGARWEPLDADTRPRALEARAS